MAILFSDNFATGDFSAWGHNDGGVINSNPAYIKNGAYSASFNYVIAAGGSSSQDDNKWLSTILASPVSHVFMRGYVFFRTPAVGRDTTIIQRKLFWMSSSTDPGTSSGDADLILDSFTGSGGLPTDTINLSFTGNANAMCSGGGITTVYDIAQLNWDTWYCIEMEIQLNTSGNSDGVLNVWVDGVLKVSNTTMQLIGTCGSQLSFFSVGRQTNRTHSEEVNEERYWNDIVIADAYIGPINPPPPVFIVNQAGVDTLRGGPGDNPTTWNFGWTTTPGNTLVAIVALNTDQGRHVTAVIDDAGDKFTNIPGAEQHEYTMANGNQDIYVWYVNDCGAAQNLIVTTDGEFRILYLFELPPCYPEVSGGSTSPIFNGNSVTGPALIGTSPFPEGEFYLSAIGVDENPNGINLPWSDDLSLAGHLFAVAWIVGTGGTQQAIFALDNPGSDEAAYAVCGVAFTTSAPTPPIPPVPRYLPFLRIPQGQGQSVDELSGSSSISEHEIDCIDPSGDLKAMLADPTNYLLGSQATFALGFPGMDLADFVPMSILQVIRAGWSTDGMVTFNLQDFQRFQKEYIWTTGGPSDWLPGDPVPLVPTGASSASNGQPIFDGNPRYLQGNPIDLLLVALQNELGIGQSSTDPTTWQLYTPGDDTTLINPNPYIDIPGLLALRDGQCNGDWVEFTLKAQETGKNWIEDQILKPYGLYDIITSMGQLTLKSMKTPPTTNPVSWTQNSIKGIPGLDRWDIVNVLQVRLNVDDSEITTAARTYNADIEYDDTASIEEFAQEVIQQAELTGIRTRWGGSARAFILSDRVFRRHGYGTPVYECEVQLRNLQPELGDYVLLTHNKLLDLKTGLVGVVDALCEVVDRQPDYSSAKFTYKLIDTRFIQPTVAYEFAPDDAPVWTSGGSGTQNLYICGDNGLYSDGSAARTIF